MKKAFLSIIFVVSFVIAKSQAPVNINNNQVQNWQNAILRADGLTEIEGVEALCLKTKCNNEDVVLVKLINKNNFRVGVEWVDAIFVNGVWYYPKNSPKKKLFIEANSTIEADCNGTEKLKVSIAGILNDPKDFQHYTVSGLQIVK